MLRNVDVQMRLGRRRSYLMEENHMGRETDNWPFVQAKYFTEVPKTTPRKVKWLVVHDMEYPEKMTAAEEVAHYFATLKEKKPDGSPIKKSAHICVDADSIVQCVKDRHVAYAAPGCNSNGIQIELAGVARQTREQWLDDYSDKLLTKAAEAIAQYLVKFEITPRKLTDDELREGKSGIIGHDQCSRVFQQSDHTDPGPNFPWDVLLERVGPLYVARLGLKPLA